MKSEDFGGLDNEQERISSSVWSDRGEIELERSVLDSAGLMFTGITEQQCRSRGCCYDASFRVSYWCFMKRGARLFTDVGHRSAIPPSPWLRHCNQSCCSSILLLFLGCSFLNNNCRMPHKDKLRVAMLHDCELMKKRECVHFLCAFHGTSTKLNNYHAT